MQRKADTKNNIKQSSSEMRDNPLETSVDCSGGPNNVVELSCPIIQKSEVEINIDPETETDISSQKSI